MGNFISKYRSKYLSARVIYAMDLCLAFAAAFVSLLSAVLLMGIDTLSAANMICYMLVAVLGYAVGEAVFHPYRNAIRHMSLSDAATLALASITKSVALMILAFAIGRVNLESMFIILFDFLITIFFLIGCRVVMVIVYEMLSTRLKSEMDIMPVLIYGKGAKAVSLVKRMTNSEQYQVKGFLSSEPVERGFTLSELPVYYFDEYEDFRRFMNRKGIPAILFAHEHDAQEEADGLVRYCYRNGIKVLVAPSVDEIVDGKVMTHKVREVKIEDLLGRDEIKIDMENIKSNFGGKVVLVTGAAGSIGSELVRQLATFGVKQLILFDNAETPLHNLRLELEERFPALDFVPVIGDVRLVNRLDYVFRTWHPQVVFHAAAYKHVPLMEENPCEAVLVNVVGSRNVANKCIEYGVEKMVMISTDKAVNPTNIMGCTKRLAEIYVQSLGLAMEKGEIEGKTKFVTTRFGNVLGSNGSVIPRFREQIEKGGPVTVTHPDIIRFFMTIPEACRLVMEAATMTTGNQIFVFDMGKPVKIDFLARRMIELAGFKPDVDIKVEYTGLRPGEKLYEEVLSNCENTEPTSHDRIRVARVREYSYADANAGNHQLEDLSRAVDIAAMVKLMKSIVPEFKSKNSRFEIYDHSEN